VSRAFADMPRYAVASAFSFVFVIGCTAALHELIGISETLSPALALAGAFVVNFTLLRAWVFPGQSAPVGRQMAETALASLVFRALEYGLFLIAHLALGIDYLLATGASVCVSALGKFFVYREIVFNRARARSASASSR
jgi:putative flippase GtrA